MVLCLFYFNKDYTESTRWINVVLMTNIQAPNESFSLLKHALIASMHSLSGVTVRLRSWQCSKIWIRLYRNPIIAYKLSVLNYHLISYMKNSLKLYSKCYQLICMSHLKEILLTKLYTLMLPISMSFLCKSTTCLCIITKMFN